MKLTVVLLAGAALALAASLWGQASEVPVRLEVVSVKVSTATDNLPPQLHGFGRMSGGPGTSTPGQFTATSVSLKSILFRYAYRLNEYQYVMLPWMDKNTYDVIAKVPPGVTQDQFRIMLQNLLIERFKIEMHHEQREHAIYDMAVAKSGLKMKPSKFDENTPPDPGPGPGGSVHLDRNPEGFPVIPESSGPMTFSTGFKGQVVMVSNKLTIKQLIDNLSVNLNMPILDKTGLQGSFAFLLHYENPTVAGVSGDASGAVATDVAPTLFDALQSQLGLKLEQRKGPIDVLVVDKAERIPIEN